MASLEQEVESSVTLQNKEFSQVHNKFIEHGWELTTNTQRQLTYSYPMSAYDEFNISIESNGISVCTPVPLGNFAYRVKLNTHVEAVTGISLASSRTSKVREIIKDFNDICLAN